MFLHDENRNTSTKQKRPVFLRDVFNILKNKYYLIGDTFSIIIPFADTESVGLACGFLLAAIHETGLVALTHTPSPMNFLSAILNRPENERPFLIVPVGFPADEVYVPELKRKRLQSIAEYYQ